jgi:transmembrane sensor
MISNEEQVRAAIAEQAGEWLLANEEGPLNARDSAALTAWLRTSPVHIEEFLGVSLVAGDLKKLREYPECSVEALIAAARAEEGSSIRTLSPPGIGSVRDRPVRRWGPALVSLAAAALLGLGLLSLWNAGWFAPAPAPREVAVLYQTHHGEQLTVRLADNSVVHLNTDSGVNVRYSATERLVTLISGEADFEAAHDPKRAFRVLAGSADIVDIGTIFDVRLDSEATVVTVLEGRVAVGLHADENQTPRSIQLGANQQLRVTGRDWPPKPSTVDAQHTTAWLHRQIVFDQEPLELVAAEFNRYCPKPIEILTPALRTLQISGVFATDDTQAFIAFLRSLKGVRVEVTPTRIRVWRGSGLAPPDYT